LLILMLSFGFFGFSLSLAAGCDVRLYEHAHTTEGMKCTLHDADGTNLHSLYGNPQGCPGNGQLSRVLVEGDCYVDLYHGTYYSGTHQRLWGNGDYAVTNAAHFTNDAVKSVRVRNSFCSSGYPVEGSCHQCRVTLGQHMTSNHNNMGRWCEKYDGYSTSSFSTNNGCPGKNEVSYIKIEGPCEMELFEHAGYEGHDWVLSGPGTYYASFQNDEHYENDEIHSFKISLIAGRRRRENTDRVTFMMSEEEKAKAGLPSAPMWQGKETQLEVHRMDVGEDEEELERLENRVMQELEEQERELIREEERLAKTATQRLFELEEREEAAPGLRDTSSSAAPRTADLLEKVRSYISTHRSTTDEDDQE